MTSLPTGHPPHRPDDGPTLDQASLERLSGILDEALQNAHEVARLTETFPNLTLGDAYRIQRLGIEKRIARGEVLSGWKMGLTSEAKRQQMGLHSPVYGELTAPMEVKGAFKISGHIHPKIEPEIAFHVKKPLQGKITREQALEACDWVCPALEILDSRYVGFKYFSLPDVVADNSSSSRFVLGTPQKLDPKVDLKSRKMELLLNGAVKESATADAISGDPVESLVQLCELLEIHQPGVAVEGWVLAGAAPSAIVLEPGHPIALRVEGFKELTVRIEA